MRRARHRSTRRGWRRVRAMLALALGVLFLGVPDPAAFAKGRAAHSDSRDRVLVVTLDGAVSPITAEALERAVDRAEREGYRALVVEIDTPGGLMTSMRDMIKVMLRSEVPVVTWVAPGGARAASAGVFVTMAGDVAAMAPGTNIGAASPVTMGGGQLDSTMAHKMMNDAAAFAKTVAAQRGRNVEWAESAVRQAVSVPEDEAVKLHVVDFVAATLPDLLAKADGRTWRRGELTRTLALKGLPTDRILPGFRQRVLSVIDDPNVAYILLALGFYGTLFELQNPGAILPGVVGGICLILAFFSLSTLPINTAGVALLVLGLVFFIAEIKVASHGVLAAGGVLSLLLGSLLLFKDGVAVAWPLILGVTLSTTLFFVFVIGFALRARRAPVTTGSGALRGVHGRALGRLAPDGQVEVRGEIWKAEAETPVNPGAEIVVTDVRQLTLRVRPASPEA